MIPEIDDVPRDKPKGTYCNILLLHVELIFAPFAQRPEREIIFPAKYFSLILFRELWDWFLKGVTAAVQSAVVM